MDHIIQIKDFQGMTAKIEGSIGLFGVGVSGEIDVRNNDKISGSVGGEENTRIKVMVSLGYRRVDEFENPSEELKEAIRIVTNNPERTAENIEAVKMIITELRTLQKENDDINEKNKKWQSAL